MFPLTTSLVVGLALCLAIESMRKYAVLAGIAIAYLHPLSSLVLLLLGGAVFTYVRFYRKGKP